MENGLFSGLFGMLPTIVRRIGPFDKHNLHVSNPGQSLWKTPGIDPEMLFSGSKTPENRHSNLLII
jgi:hypothetical protein